MSYCKDFRWFGKARTCKGRGRQWISGISRPSGFLPLPLSPLWTNFCACCSCTDRLLVLSVCFHLRRPSTFGALALGFSYGLFSNRQPPNNRGFSSWVPKIIQPQTTREHSHMIELQLLRAFLHRSSSNCWELESRASRKQRAFLLGVKRLDGALMDPHVEWLWPIHGLVCQVFFCESRKLFSGGNLRMVESLNFLNWVLWSSKPMSVQAFFGLSWILLCVRLLYAREQVESSREGAFSSVGSLLCILVNSNPLTHELSTWELELLIGLTSLRWGLDGFYMELLQQALRHFWQALHTNSKLPLWGSLT